MKTLLISALLFLLALSSFGQTISGKVINANSENALEFVSIGIIGQPMGCITNEQGIFSIDIKDLATEERVKFSMIGFKSQVFTIKELGKNESVIRLEEKPFQLSEIIIRPSGKLKKVGTTNYTTRGGVCGWGGTQFGKGHEIGTEIDLGTKPVKLKTLHIRLYKQSFDSTLFRLHIRSIANNLPAEELLNDNIIISVIQESGWFDVDLNEYDIILSGQIALSIEWVKIYGVNKDRLMRMNNNKEPSANVLFNIKRKRGAIFTRWGSEAKWSRYDDRSPSFYLSIQE